MAGALAEPHPSRGPRENGRRERQALRGGPRYDVEYRVVRPDGAVRVVHSQGDVTRDESGRPVRQFGVLQDITELRQTERRLCARASSATALLFEKANDAIFLVNERDEILDVNERACTLLGYSREELLNDESARHASTGSPWAGGAGDSRAVREARERHVSKRLPSTAAVRVDSWSK